jgi:Trypsin-like peptidase domain
LLTSTLVISNNHVFVDPWNSRVAEPTDAEGAKALFNFEIKDGDLKPTKEYGCRPDWLFAANQHLDYAIVAVEGRPGRRWGRIPVSMDPVSNGEDVFIIGHPDGKPKMIARSDNQVVEIDPPFFRYRADTLEGSSGSPILNRHGRLIGVHHRGPPGKEYNEGILITAIYEDVPRSVRARLDNVLAADR